MKIGIDFDGVILDTERGCNFYADYWSAFSLNKERKRSDSTMQEGCFDWTDEEIDYFYNNFYDDITKKSPFIVGAKEILTKLKEEGHELYVITLRGLYREQEQIDAQNKLDELGVKFDGIFWSQRNKVELCKELGISVMIDDGEYNVEKFVNQDITVLYFKESQIREINSPNVRTVHSWMDIYRQIQELSKGGK